MTITLPDELRDELEHKARAAGFATILDYFLSLVPVGDEDEDEDEDEVADSAGPPGLSPKNRAELEAMLDAGMNSGPPIRMTPEFWEERRRVLEERIAARGVKS